MTVRILSAPPKHFTECDVCEGQRVVTVRSVARVEHGTKADRAGFRWRPARLAVVIPCPQCTGAEELIANLPRDAGGGPRATA